MNDLKIVALGGGTGQSTMLRGLKHCTNDITAIVSVSDDGGGSGLLRHDLGMLPPGDIRACIMALANTEPTMAKLLQYRFDENSGALSGQCFGNLFLAALNGIYSRFDEAVSVMGDVLAITGHVLPVTTADVRLRAKFANGEVIFGESNIISAKKVVNSPIVGVELEPARPKALSSALQAIEQADMLILGPGSLYTSVIPNLLVDGVVDAIKYSQALKVYVANIMTQEGETENYSAYDHVEALQRHSYHELFDVCIVNNALLPPVLAERYLLENAEMVAIERGKFAKAGIRLIEMPLLANNDIIVRHDPARLAAELIKLYKEERL